MIPIKGIEYCRVIIITLMTTTKILNIEVIKQTKVITITVHTVCGHS